MIGEMEDVETIDTALKAAETGHLVISSLHTPDAVSTITRVVAMFPTEEQEVARIRLCEALQAVVSQRLVPRTDGHGRVPAVEILICTAVARDLMKDPARTHELHDYIAEAREQYGMQTFDQHLVELVMDEVVTYEAAVAAATNLKEFERQMRDERRRTRVAAPAEATPRR
jgi:twitching motility protein PilT